jgi:hypothetical protein
MAAAAGNSQDGNDPVPTAPGGGSGPGTFADDPDRPHFTSISMRELEFEYRRNADGAESSVDSEEEEGYPQLAHKPSSQRKRRKRTVEARGNGPAMTDDERMAAAAFGCEPTIGQDEEVEDGGARAAPATAVDVDDDDDDDSCADCDLTNDGGSIAAGSSAVPEQRLLPIRGEHCVGCTYDRSIVQRVNDFVHSNCTTMTETALFRAASMFYKQSIMEPRQKEGVHVPLWRWKSIRTHYVFHVTDPVLQRAAAVRTLGAVRAVQENALLKVNGDGTKSLDHKGVDYLLKVIALQEKSISALDSQKMPPPPPRR